MNQQAAYRSGSRTIGQGRSVRELAWKRLPAGAVIAALVAAVANVLVYAFASATGAISDALVLPSVMGPSRLTPGLVAVTSIIPVAWATIFFAGLGLIARWPARLFRILATVVLLLSLSMLATVPGLSLPMRISLAAMHVVVWAACVSLIPMLAAKAER